MVFSLFRWWPLAAVLLFVACGQEKPKLVVETPKELSDTAKARLEVTHLIRSILAAEQRGELRTYTWLADSADLSVGVDLADHEAALRKWRSTGFFTERFIENYNRIVMTLDSLVRNGICEKFTVHEVGYPIDWAAHYPAFSKSHEEDDTSSAYVRPLNIQSEKGLFVWSLHYSPDIGFVGKDSVFVVKENGRWKVDSLSSFHYAEAIRVDPAYLVKPDSSRAQ